MSEARLAEGKGRQAGVSSGVSASWLLALEGRSRERERERERVREIQLPAPSDVSDRRARERERRLDGETRATG